VRSTVWTLTVSAAFAQQSAVFTRTFDVNGHPLPSVVSTQSGATRSQITRDINGRTVPVESSEERVLSDSSGIRITERIIKRYDPNGNPGPPERIRIEERKQVDGGVSTTTTISRGDSNGAFQLAERSTTVTRTASAHTQSITTVERPTLNGSMDLVERNEQSIDTTGDKTSENTTTFRRDANGKLAEFAKKTRQAVSSNGQVNENLAEYESASTGQIRLMRKSTTLIEPAGTRQVTVYLPDAEGKMQLSQQQMIEKTSTPTGTMEITSVRFAIPSDPGKLGPVRKVEETVCMGTCGRSQP
jgi:hypothetical protein